MGGRESLERFKGFAVHSGVFLSVVTWMSTPMMRDILLCSGPEQHPTANYCTSELATTGRSFPQPVRATLIAALVAYRRCGHNDLL